MSKAQLSITVDEEIEQKIEKLVSTKKYANVSHFFEYAATQQLAKEARINAS